MKFIKYFLAFAILLAIGSCKKDSPGSPAPGGPIPTGPYIYVGGNVPLAAGGTQGIYFKNPISKVVLPGSLTSNTLKNASFVSSVVSFDSIVYMTADLPGYWKKDSFITVNYASHIQYLAMDNNNNIALAGYDHSLNLAYWWNNNETGLMHTFDQTVYPNEGVMFFGLSGIALSGSNVLLSGSYTFMDEPTGTTADTSTLPGLYETLWHNGNLQILYHDYWNVNFSFTSTVGVVVLGKDVFVASRISLDSSRKFEGGYWKNGAWNSINNGDFWPNSICASGTDVYISGYTYTLPGYSHHKAVYWKNGNLITLDGTAATATAVYGTDVYVLGIDNNDKYVVWKNGKVIETLGSTSRMELKYMAIGN